MAKTPQEDLLRLVELNLPLHLHDDVRLRWLVVADGDEVAARVDDFVDGRGLGPSEGVVVGCQRRGCKGGVGCERRGCKRLVVYERGCKGVVLCQRRVFSKACEGVVVCQNRGLNGWLFVN